MMLESPSPGPEARRSNSSPVMKLNLYFAFASAMATLAILLAARAAVPGETSPAPPRRSGFVEVELQGKVVCLPEVLHQRYQTELSAEHVHILGFATRDGALYTLLRTRYSEALFIDPQLRERELLLKGRVFSRSNVLEVTRTRSVRDGVVFDLYYFCTICNIESVSAGPCACCQDTVELREKPLLRQPVQP